MGRDRFATRSGRRAALLLLLVGLLGGQLAVSDADAHGHTAGHGAPGESEEHAAHRGSGSHAHPDGDRAGGAGGSGEAHASASEDPGAGQECAHCTCIAEGMGCSLVLSVAGHRAVAPLAVARGEPSLDARLPLPHPRFEVFHPPRA